MATPHVAGVAALVRSAVPGATAAQVAQAIRESAVPLPSLQGKTVTGGRADAPGAIAAARRLAGRPPSSPPPGGPGGGSGGSRASSAVTTRHHAPAGSASRGICDHQQPSSRRWRDASRRVASPGAREDDLTLSAAADRVLRSQAPVKVRVTVTFKPKHARAKSTSRTVTLHP